MIKPVTGGKVKKNLLSLRSGTINSKPIRASSHIHAMSLIYKIDIKNQFTVLLSGRHKLVKH